MRFAVARARQIFGRDLREHDVVQHPVAERRLADLLDRSERLMNRAIGGGLTDQRLNARDAGERFGTSIRIGNGVGCRERAGERHAAPLHGIVDGLSVRNRSGGRD